MSGFGLLGEKLLAKGLVTNEQFERAKADKGKSEKTEQKEQKEKSKQADKTR